LLANWKGAWWQALLALAMGVGGAWLLVEWTKPASLHERPAQSLLPDGGDFTLQSEAGDVSLSDFRGKVVVLYFGFTACPDVCPTSMGTMKQAFSQLSEEELAKVQGLFVSVDPERDSLRHVQEYGQYFHTSINGLTGKPDVLADIAKQYHVFYRKVDMKDSAMGYTVDHTSAIYLIDPQGQLKAHVQHAVPPAELANQIRDLLAP